MQFLVLGYDGNDEKAMERRLAARPAHLEEASELAASGKWLYSAALMDDDGKMIGSMIVCDYPTREDLDKWLSDEPYVTGKVWEKIIIHGAQVSPFYANK